MNIIQKLLPLLKATSNISDMAVQCIGNISFGNPIYSENILKQGLA